MFRRVMVSYDPLLQGFVLIMIRPTYPTASVAVPIPKQTKNVQHLFLTPWTKCARQERAKSTMKIRLIGFDGR